MDRKVLLQLPPYLDVFLNRILLFFRMLWFVEVEIAFMYSFFASVSCIVSSRNSHDAETAAFSI